MQFSPTYIKIQWGFIFSIIAIDVIWTSLDSFTYLYNVADLIFTFTILGFFLSIYFVYAYIRPDNRLKTTMMTIFLFLFFSLCVDLYCYLVYSTNMPLVTGTLDYVDSLFGFNALNLVIWMKAHPFWDHFFGTVYNVFAFQVILIFFYFGFYKSPLNFQRFALLYMISLFLTISVGGLFPAIGTHAWYHFQATPTQLSELDHLFVLRQKIISFKGSDALVEFPSYHTTLSLIYIYIFRYESKLIFIPLALLNILIVFSCLSHGGHFLVDILGGIVIFFGTIWGENLIYKAVKKYGTISNLIASEFKKKQSPSRYVSETAT